MPSFGFTNLFSSPAPKPPPKVERWTYFSGYVLHTSDDDNEASLLRDRLADAMPTNATAYVIGAKPIDAPKVDKAVPWKDMPKDDNASYAISIPASWIAPSDKPKKPKKPKNEPPPTLESAYKELQDLRIKRARG